jgi:hypothetical protein
LQPVATGRKSNGLKNRRNKRKPLPCVATSCYLERMVRRGATVRVRKRALQRPRKSGFLFPQALHDLQCAVGVEPFMEPSGRKLSRGAPGVPADEAMPGRSRCLELSMEPLWSPADATSDNQSRIAHGLIGLAASTNGPAAMSPPSSQPRLGLVRRRGILPRRCSGF